MIARRLIQEHLELRKSSGPVRDHQGRFIDREARIAVLESEMAEIDRQLCINATMAAKCAALVYKYYRLGFDSVQYAAELDMSPPGVRQVLTRMGKVARELGLE